MQRWLLRNCLSVPLIPLEFASLAGVVLQHCQYIFNIPRLLPTMRQSPCKTAAQMLSPGLALDYFTAATAPEMHGITGFHFSFLRDLLLHGRQ
jgi:hypothetical protein